MKYVIHMLLVHHKNDLILNHVGLGTYFIEHVVCGDGGCLGTVTLWRMYLHPSPEAQYQDMT